MVVNWPCTHVMAQMSEESEACASYTVRWWQGTSSSTWEREEGEEMDSGETGSLCMGAEVLGVFCGSVQKGKGGWTIPRLQGLKVTTLLVGQSPLSDA